MSRIEEEWNRKPFPLGIHHDPVLYTLISLIAPNLLIRFELVTRPQLIFYITTEYVSGQKLKKNHLKLQPSLIRLGLQGAYMEPTGYKPCL